MRSRPFFLFSEYAVPVTHRPQVDAQCRRDLLARQSATHVFNPIIFFLVAITILTVNPASSAFLVLLGLGGFLALSIIYRRYAMDRFRESIEQPSRADWLHVHLSLACSSLTWGVFMAMAILPTPINQNFALVYTATIGLAAGGAISLALKSSMVKVFVLGLLLPSILVSLSGYSLEPSGLAMLLAALALGLQWVSANARAEYVVSVLSNLILQEQSQKLTHLTTMDWLTKVYNRSHFDTIMGQELGRVNRIGYPLTLLMIDIDHFKHINDTHGHLIGDECLVKTASRIKECLKRETDVVARYGGEEFCILLPGMDTNEAKDLAETIREHVSTSVIWHYNNPISVTVSIGGTTVSNEPSLSRDYLFKYADAALYRAKESGRNRVCWADEPANDDIRPPEDDSKPAS